MRFVDELDAQPVSAIAETTRSAAKRGTRIVLASLLILLKRGPHYRELKL
jgi:hypothetical protein